jgi:hypothetical protein
MRENLMTLSMELEKRLVRPLELLVVSGSSSLSLPYRFSAHSSHLLEEKRNTIRAAELEITEAIETVSGPPTLSILPFSDLPSPLS